MQPMTEARVTDMPNMRTYWAIFCFLIPSWNSAFSFDLGYGWSGTGRPRKWQSGSQPSPGRNTRSLSEGTVAITCKVKKCFLLAKDNCLTFLWNERCHSRHLLFLVKKPRHMISWYQSTSCTYLLIPLVEEFLRLFRSLSHSVKKAEVGTRGHCLHTVNGRLKWRGFFLPSSRNVHRLGSFF